MFQKSGILGLVELKLHRYLNKGRRDPGNAMTQQPGPDPFFGNFREPIPEHQDREEREANQWNHVNDQNTLTALVMEQRKFFWPCVNPSTVNGKVFHQARAQAIEAQHKIKERKGGFV